jgi:hypothetical protein
MEEMVVVLTGNVVDGIEVVGPFVGNELDVWEEAARWAEEYAEEWNLVKVEAPQDFETIQSSFSEEEE